ncbi:D(2) dopamine receptor A-like [Hydractinia symbiolongicarpus]|uniref:D(2) dopamine receptor A-like n=1 Tax=Hydractinia symbiolongicarpus TaxID=13093 RepID=UPI00254AF9C6|nr:D(2) dopamine receptor A-like [Hydractinia symbiolongicarpus]
MSSVYVLAMSCTGVLVRSQGDIYSNDTMMNSSDVELVCEPSSSNVFDGIVIIIIITLSIIENALVLIIIYKFKEFRTPTNVYVACLSVADLFVSLIPLPLAFALYVCSWQPGTVSTSIYTVLDIMSSVVSVSALTAIACDRYFIIMHPYKYERSMSVYGAIFVSVFVWLFAITSALLSLIITVLHYTLFIVIAAYAVPTSLMLFCHIRIAVVARRHANTIITLERQGKKARSTRESFFRKIPRIRRASTLNSSIRSTSTTCSAVEVNSPIGTKIEHTVQKAAFVLQSSEAKPSVQICENALECDFKRNLSLVPEEVPGILKLQQNYKPSVVAELTSNDSIIQNQLATRAEKNTESTDANRNIPALGEISPRKQDISVESRPKFKTFVLRNVAVRRQNSVLRRETLRIVGHLRRLRRELKGTLMLTVVMAIYLCLWTPFISMNIKFYNGTFDASNSVHIELLKYFKILHYSNSAFNPACYILMNSKWRKAFKTIISTCGPSLSRKHRVSPA